MPLPLLREEIDLSTGPVLPDGQPSWILHDPVRNQFFRIDWTTFEILSRWSLNDAQAIVESVNAASTLHIAAADVEHVLAFLLENQLIQMLDPDGAGKLAQRLKLIEGTVFKWLLHHYLFFRVPLLKPDRWLTRALPWAEFFFGRRFMWATVAAFVAGMFLVVRHWDSFLNTLFDTFDWSGFVAYGFALFVVKLLHELGHAFTAKRHGCRVPTMGLAFLVMWPMAYTDTNETWRLKSNWARLQVASAGIVTELGIAVWATLAWGLLPDGALRGAAFFLATTSWVATLAVNASPFMRFDGYFILCDLLDMPNLHARSFALARWRLREWLFDLRQPKPEHLAHGKEVALMCFAWVTWIYRLVVFLGIAVLVYQFFIKLVGIFLFAVELIWFIIMPVWKEVQVWRKFEPQIRAQAHSLQRTRLSMAGLGLLLVFFLLPWPGRVMSSGWLRPVQSLTLFAPPSGAQLVEMPVRYGQHVQDGQMLVSMTLPELASRLQVNAAKLEKLGWVAASSGLQDETRQRMLVNQEDYATAWVEREALLEEASKFVITAPFGGELIDIDPDYQPGQWLAKKERIGTLAVPGKMLVETYLDEEAVKRIEVGDGGVFTTDGREGPILRVRVVQIDQDATRMLTQGFLASVAGGHIPVREKNGQLFPEQAIYHVVLEVLSDPDTLARQSWRGTLVIRSQAQPLAWRYLKNLVAVVVRESGF